MGTVIDYDGRKVGIDSGVSIALLLSSWTFVEAGAIFVGTFLTVAMTLAKSSSLLSCNMSLK
jgi:hypothetical protein